MLLFAADHVLPPLLREHWLVLLPPLFGFIAIYLLLPKARQFKPLWGGIAAALALILAGSVLIRMETLSVESLLFYVFAGIAVGSGGMMITQRNPVHAALSFAIVVLSTCGLFLLQAAPFLMAATIIIYAGAIVVTFLFVVMLAQQEGASNADHRSREPFLATLAGCVLMASLLCILQKTYNGPAGEDAVLRELRQIAAVENETDIKGLLGDPRAQKDGNKRLALVEKLNEMLANPDKDELDPDAEGLNAAWFLLKTDLLKQKADVLLERIQSSRERRASLALHAVPGKAKTPGHFEPGRLPAANVAAIGKTMFTDYLIAVELAATLLLVATIGAIVIAGRRSEELR